MPWFSQRDFDLWDSGAFHNAYSRLGAHINKRGCWFGVWAPHADQVSVIGDFNGWESGAHRLRKVGGLSGLWEGYVRGAKPGHHYKYRITRDGYAVDKTDPFAFSMESPAAGGHPVRGLSAVVCDLSAFEWNDQAWTSSHQGPGSLAQPIAIYEVHIGSWRHAEHGRSLSYREIAQPLADHVIDMGFTHVEFLPVMEHPFYGSWGYQVVGYFAPTFRYGSPTDFMYLVDYLHQRGIGVLLDWVPAHFATDPQGLVYYDGGPLLEYEDPRMRHHPDWGTYVFDYNKPGVRNFLISGALFWLDAYHIDGLRADAVASMLYRDYSRPHWTPNDYGGRENLEAIDFLRKTNEAVYLHCPESLMVAEESTAWPGVTRPTHSDGLGFLYKWNMGWMHDTLTYVAEDPVHRKYHHDTLTFPLIYAFSEQYILPLSHDEVVHGKGSLWGKMPGDSWQKAANLRLLFGHMIGHPGKKLLFMGGEFGQTSEWHSDSQLDWDQLADPLHCGVRDWLRDLLRTYRECPELWFDHPENFSWIDFEDRQHSIVSYIRSVDDSSLLFVFNFTPVPRDKYRVGVPSEGLWKCRLNSDDVRYGGSGHFVTPPVMSDPINHNNQDHSIVVSLPPLAVLVLGQQAGKAT